MDHMGRLLLEGPPAADGRGVAANPSHRPTPPCVTGTSVRDAASDEAASFRRPQERSWPQKSCLAEGVPAFSAKLTCQSQPGLCVGVELRNTFSHELRVAARQRPLTAEASAAPAALALPRGGTGRQEARIRECVDGQRFAARTKRACALVGEFGPVECPDDAMREEHPSDPAEVVLVRDETPAAEW